MMRITREEEHYIGRARAGLIGRAKVGFRKDGRITGARHVHRAGQRPVRRRRATTGRPGDRRRSPTSPRPMRWRGVTVLTNTPPRTSQRSPGGMQVNAHHRADHRQGGASKLGIDQVELPQDQRAGRQGAVRPGAAATARQAYVTSAFVQRSARPGRASCSTGTSEKAAQPASARGTEGARHRRRGQPVTAGSIGFDGLLIIRPDGKLQVQSGIGNLGTHSVIDCRASPPSARHAVGAVSRSSGATPPSTCRGRACRPAARRCTR